MSPASEQPRDDTAPETPQIYLITPPEVELSRFPRALAKCLDAVEVACVRLALSSQDEDHLSRAADALRDLTHARDIPLVIDTHVGLVERLGLDGVHLTDAARSVVKIRKLLGPDPIVGAYCGASRHDGMTAGEMGADYVAFGPVTASILGDGTVAEDDLFGWWSEMIEVPVIAEGGLTEPRIRTLAPMVDFFAVGQEIWKAEKPEQALIALASEMV